MLRGLKPLYMQVLVGIALGTLVGALWPQFGEALKPLGDAFIRLIKLIIAPVIFCTVAVGIAQMGDIKKFGRVGGKALLYFEVVSLLALLIGIAVALIVQPGRGFGIDPAALDPSIAAGYAKGAAERTGFVDHLMHIIPETFFGAFASGDVLQVLFVAILTGFACSRLGEFGAQTARVLDHASHVFFSIIHIVVHAAPVGAFGAMAFTIGKYGLTSLLPLGTVVLAFYGTCVLFVGCVLGLIARSAGFSLLRFLAYIREELLIVLGAASSEAVLPQLMEKLERLGTNKSIVGLVVPTGYSFNPDGTSIYMTLAALFLAQATGIELSYMQIATLLGVAMLTSKGASGVTGAGFIGLAATLAVVPDIPIQSLALLVGIDRFMSTGRALVNLIGNGVATLVVARWENELDTAQLRAELARGPAQAEEDRDHEVI
ncbi:dicarboxylate/amino acid:cation symporter [Sphingomonas canadensis]|uniref:Dicarboxylate/amino acid:cation symporter n=1 Tax=Sphingomonas canadensis TaxID=1219257 RepID=A0ABW3H747_9SPHN|nr:dicarboxylate/amino acid:cation symporter [Sphingomonas canadensis]MCW3836215.1 dicarboxylate/amino acid:cation symporter [Sphingomonas canadensis]